MIIEVPRRTKTVGKNAELVMIKSLPISSAFSAALSAPAVSKSLTRSGSDSSFHGEGYRKIWARLRFASVRASPRRVRRVMGDTGIDMSGRRPLIKGYFAVLRLIVDAVMSSACLMRVMTPVGPDVVR